VDGSFYEDQLSEEREDEIVVEIDIPDEATDAEVVEMVGELVLRADELHRSLGGSGLKVESVEVIRSPG
jgi:hypothetical protein